MNAMPPDLPPQGSAPRKVAHGLSVRWNALHDAAEAVAVLAGLEPEKPSHAVRAFPKQVQDIGGWQVSLADQGVEDITAMLRPGLAALLAVNARGQDATAPALTLWREFHTAREALLRLVPEGGRMGPRRSA